MGLFDKTEGKAVEAMGKTQNEYGKITDSPENQIGGKAKELYGVGKQKASDILDTAQQCTKSAQSHIKTNPMSAIAISAGVGIVVGYLLGKKSS